MQRKKMIEENVLPQVRQLQKVGTRETRYTPRPSAVSEGYLHTTLFGELFKYHSRFLSERRDRVLLPYNNTNLSERSLRS